MAMFSFTDGVLPPGATFRRAAGTWSRTKRITYTDFDFTSGMLPKGVTVQRAAGPWSRRSPTGALELGTSANTARFDYDPPVENRIPSSTVAQTKSYLANTTSSDSGGVTTVNAAAVGSTQFSAEYYGIAAATTGDARTFSVDLRGDVGGEVVYLVAQGSGPSEVRAYLRCVLTTAWQRFELSVTAGMTVQFFEIGANNRGTAPTEAIPAQVYYIRRRQLNSGPIALAYTETTGTAIYSPPVCRGILFEPSRTNYFLTSDVLTGRVTAGTVTFSTGRASPTGAAAARIAFADNSIVAPAANTPITAGQSWTTSVYALADPATTINFGTNGLGATGNNKGVTSNVTTSWSRLTYTNSPASADSGLYMVLGTGAVGAGTSGSITARTIEATGIQMELGATASSYIATTTAIATRPVESIRIAVPTMADGNYVCTLFYVPGTYGSANFDVSLGRVVSGVMTIGIPDAQRPGVLQMVRVPSLPSGVIEVGTSADTPRFDYDPATGALRGMLAEPERTNMFLQSAINNTGWTRENANIVPDVLTGLQGSPNLSRLDATTSVPGGGAIRIYRQGSDNDPTKIYSRSVFCKLGTPAYKFLWITRDGGPQICFNMETGVVVTGSAGLVGAVVALPNGVFRFAVAGAGANAGGNNTFFWLSDRSAAPSVGNSTPPGTFCYIGGAQSELGAVATSYIPTVGTTITRPAEVLPLDWTSQAIPDGQANSLYTFADASVKMIEQQIADGLSFVPVFNLSNYTIRSISILQTPAARSMTIGDRALRSTVLTDIGSRVATIRN